MWYYQITTNKFNKWENEKTKKRENKRCPVVYVSSSKPDLKLFFLFCILWFRIYAIHAS